LLLKNKIGNQQLFHFFDDIRQYVKFVQEGLRMHADHVFVRELALEARLNALEKKGRIRPAEELKLSHFHKLSPEQVLQL
jgi:hypothetical protein